MTAKRSTKKFKARRVGLSHGKGQGSVRRNGNQRVRDAINLENLEGRQLMSVVNVADFGAKPNDGADDKGAIQAAINAAKPGDSVVFNAGTYNLASQVQLKGGITMTSASGKQDALLDSKFGIAGGNGWVNNANWAFKGGDVTGLTVTNLKFKANSGIFNFNVANNVTFKFNDFQWGYEGNYYNRHAFWVGNSANGLVINQNYFHDSENADRNLEVWGWANGSYSFNTFYKVNDGGHIMNPGDNFTMEGNYGRLIHRMGIEIQQNFYNPDPSKAPKNLKVIDNVFFDWNKPFWDSMGLSVPVAANAYIARNYIRHNAYNGVWGQADSSGKVRGSYGIEGPNGAFAGIIEDNILIGERNVMAVACPGQGTIVRNNKIYGKDYGWGKVGGEPGQAGFGRPVDQNNSYDPNYGNAPQPPAKPEPNPNPGPDPNPNPGPDPSPAPNPSIVELWATARSSSIAKLSWGVKNLSNIAKFRIDVVSTRGSQKLQSFDVAADQRSATVSNLTANWEIDFTVTAILKDGKTQTSSPVTLHMPAGGPTPNPNPNPNPNPAPNPNPTPTPVPASLELHARARSSTIAKLSWIAKGMTVDHYVIEAISTRGGEHIKTLEVAGQQTSATMTGLTANWEIDFTITAVLKNGQQVKSSAVTLHMPKRTTRPAPAPAPTPDDQTLTKRYMDGFTPVGTDNGLGEPETDMSNGGNLQRDGRTITIAGEEFDKGIGVTAKSKLVYNLGGRQKYFCSFIGMDDETESKGQIKFQVWGDGKLLYESDTVTNTSRARKVKVDVQGVKQMWLVVTNPTGALPSNTHADWAQSYMLAAA